MVIKTALVTAGLLVMSNLPSSGQVRNWLAVPEVKGTIATDVLKFTDTSINFGPRAQVKVYRPDGVYELDTSGNREPEAASKTNDVSPK